MSNKQADSASGKYSIAWSLGHTVAKFALCVAALTENS